MQIIAACFAKKKKVKVLTKGEIIFHVFKKAMMQKQDKMNLKLGEMRTWVKLTLTDLFIPRTQLQILWENVKFQVSLS